MYYSWLQHQKRDWAGAHRKIRTPWASEVMMQEGYRDQKEGREEVAVEEEEDRWHSPMVQKCWGVC